MPAKEDDDHDEDDENDLFRFLLGGELHAAPLLLEHAKSLGMTTEDVMERCRPITAQGQAYPSYWARLALNKQRGAAAAAVAINFPTWGSMCAALLNALQAHPAYGYSEMSSPDRDDQKTKKALAFVEFFATPIPRLDEMAAKIMKKENVKSKGQIITPVRLLQEYEIMFWDACYEAK